MQELPLCRPVRETEIKWHQVLRIWWLIFWRATLGAVTLGFVAGLIIGFVGSTFFHAGAETLKNLSVIAGAVVGVICQIGAVGMALDKQYSGFRIAVIDIN